MRLELIAHSRVTNLGGWGGHPITLYFAIIVPPQHQTKVGLFEVIIYHSSQKPMQRYNKTFIYANYFEVFFEKSSFGYFMG